MSGLRGAGLPRAGRGEALSRGKRLVPTPTYSMEIGGEGITFLGGCTVEAG